MAKFKAKRLGLASGNPLVVVLDDDDAFALGVRRGSRVLVRPRGTGGYPAPRGVLAVVDVATAPMVVEGGEVGLYDEVADKLESLVEEPVDGALVDVGLANKPPSFDAIRRKVAGKALAAEEITRLVTDAKAGNLLPVEIAAFVTAVQIHGANVDEIVQFCLELAHSGDVLDFGPEVYDKHSTGGVPGNKVSLVIVPIVAAAGLFIPKTSTRAITSPSGTADSMEVFAPVAFDKGRVVELLKRTGSGIFWGGSMDLAPADRAFLEVEKALGMDPRGLMIASILAQKLALGVKKLVLDVPCGRGTKFPTVDDGRKYALLFKEVAARVGVEATCLLTSAQQPIGHAVGPALEAREALTLLCDPEGPGSSSSLRNKSCELAGALLEMAGKAPAGGGKVLARELLSSGAAHEAFRKIVANQGGDPDVTPEKVKVGPHVCEVVAPEDGFVTGVLNERVSQVARLAGCPAAKGAGVELVHKVGHSVRKGDVTLRVYSESEERLREAVAHAVAKPPHVLGGMTIEKV